MRATLTSILAVMATLMIAGCGRTSSPSKDDIKSYVTGALPPFLQVASVEADAIGNGLFNFKVTAKPHEPLYILVEGSPYPELILISEVQSADEALSAYGRFRAEKTVDRWSFNEISISSGLERLGAPRGSFPPAALISGSQAAKDAVAAIEKSRAEEEKLAAEKAEQSRQEAEALAAKQRREAEENAAKVVAEERAYKDRLLEATKVGQIYVGVLAFYDAPQQNLEMRVTEQSMFSLTVEFKNPDEPEQKARWKGEINSKPSPGKGPIQLSAIDSSRQGLRFYTTSESGSMSLRLTEDGLLEGEGRRPSGFPFTIKLQRR